MLTANRIGALDIAEEIAAQIGSYVDATFIEFVLVEGDLIRCWYMNSGGKGPSFEVTLSRTAGGWRLKLTEHPPGTEQPYEIP